MTSLVSMNDIFSAKRYMRQYLPVIFEWTTFLKGRIPFALFRDGEFVGRYDSFNLKGKLTSDSTRSDAHSAVVLPDHVVLCYELEINQHLTDDEIVRMVQTQNIIKSPFDADETVYGIDWVAYYRSGSRCLKIFLSSRSISKTEIEKIGSSISLHDVAVVFESAEGMLVESSWEGGAGWRAATKRQTIVNWFLILVIVMISYGLAATPVLKNWLRLQDAKNQYSHLSKENLPTDKLREQLLSRQEFLAAFDQREKVYVSPVEVLSIVTQLLPDNSFLYSIDITSEGVRIHGQAPNSAGLMARLSGAPEIAEVKAVAAATKAPGASGETFQLILILSNRAKGSN